jgi:hypothetical protein
MALAGLDIGQSRASIRWLERCSKAADALQALCMIAISIT